jgi:hypothetical protein
MSMSCVVLRLITEFVSVLLSWIDAFQPTRVQGQQPCSFVDDGSLKKNGIYKSLGQRGR